MIWWQIFIIIISFGIIIIPFIIGIVLIINALNTFAKNKIQNLPNKYTKLIIGLVCIFISVLSFLILFLLILMNR